ncbi:Dam family site-specific DNA-(adenine-N6)-methyltransferase [Providencia manganoxydans]|uniref:Dam family site-specific DNA-(adenine-N6)-methyltransferase n=1 Tax=Providencia manganoxydans TaxID=2923283 RepID=UPI0034E46FE0
MAVVAKNRTVLKWVGSKVGVIEQLRQHLPNTKRLVEPFAGSCAVMMNTDYEQYLIADINEDLINFHLTMQSLPLDFLSNAEYYFRTFNQENSYYNIRDIFNRTKKNMTMKGAAVNFLYLNRHCYNGLCRYSERTGFNVPYGNYKKPYLPKKEITFFLEKSQQASFYAQTWQKTLDHVVRGDGIYCDPPYLNTFSRYNSNGFSLQEHENLAKTLNVLWSEIDVPSTISNSIDAKEMYLDMGFTVYEITAPRSISAKGSRKPVTEIIAVLGGH